MLALNETILSVYRPPEYHFLQGVLKEKRQAEMRAQELLIKEGKIKDFYETEYDKYLLMLIKKMEARMDQFPVYHT